MRGNMGDDNGRPMMGASSALQEKQKSFMSFGFSAEQQQQQQQTPGIVSGALANTRRESQVAKP
jgi:alkylhydroperoxidase/carboxymuconolactone decarboxylase family protein YurZ